MTRMVDDRGVLDRFCEQFCSIVEKHAHYMIVSGYVAIASGRTRGTEDIDIIISPISAERFSALHNELVKKGFHALQSDDPAMLYEYLRDQTGIRYVEKNAVLPNMELKFAKDALDEEQIKNKVKLPLTGLSVWFAPIEANIAFKEEYLKSVKDLEDAKHLRLTYKNTITEKGIAQWKTRIKKYRL